MKIGVFFESMPQDIGGGFTFQETVLRGLPALAGENEFVVFHYGPAPSLPGITCVSLGSLRARPLKRALRNALAPVRAAQFKNSRLRGKGTSPTALSPLDQAASAAGIDLLWFPTPNAEKVDCPYIATVWDLEHRAQPYFPEVSANGEWEARERYYAGILPRASYVITGTETGKREIERCYGVAPERIRLLKHPTPDFALAATGETHARPKRLPAGDFVFYPAQFWAHKNHGVLLKALAQLKASGAAIHLALVGSDKGNRAHVESMAKRLGVADYVHFLGFVSREELVYLYRNAVALAYSSLCGPENLPPLEAFALGCPVLASDIPGSREQLGDSARLVAPLDAGEWARAIRQWQADPTAREGFRARGRARALAYTGNHFLSDLQRIFGEFGLIRELWP